MRRKCKQIDGVHQVRRIATETGETQVLEEAFQMSLLFEFLPQRAAADDPKLRRRKLLQHPRNRLEQFAITLLFRQMPERADDRRVGIGPELGPHRQWRADRHELFRRQRIMQHGDFVRRDALLDKVLLHRAGDGQQMRLIAVPSGGGETLHVADRLRAANAFEPPAPPTGARKGRLHHLGPMFAHCASQGHHGQRVELAADVALVEIDAVVNELRNRR